MPLHDLLRRFNALKHAPRTGGELTVTTRPAPSRAVRMPDPRPSQKTMTALCETLHAVQAQNRVLAERLAALEQGKFAATGQPATLTVTVRPGPSQAPAPTRPHQPAAQPNVRPCPMVKQVPDVGYYAPASATSHAPYDYSQPDSVTGSTGGCPLCG